MSECERLRNTFGSLWGHARNWESRAALAPFLAIFCALAFLPFKYHSTSDICTHTHRHVTVLNDVGTCQKESELRGIRKKNDNKQGKKKGKRQVRSANLEMKTSIHIRLVMPHCFFSPLLFLLFSFVLFFARIKLSDLYNYGTVKTLLPATSLAYYSVDIQISAAKLDTSLHLF